MAAARNYHERERRRADVLRRLERRLGDAAALLVDEPEQDDAVVATVAAAWCAVQERLNHIGVLTYEFEDEPAYSSDAASGSVDYGVEPGQPKNHVVRVAFERNADDGRLELIVEYHSGTRIGFALTQELFDGSELPQPRVITDRLPL